MKVGFSFALGSQPLVILPNRIVKKISFSPLTFLRPRRFFSSDSFCPTTICPFVLSPEDGVSSCPDADACLLNTQVLHFYQSPYFFSQFLNLNKNERGFLLLNELLCSFTFPPFFKAAFASLKSVRISFACSE